MISFLNNKITFYKYKPNCYARIITVDGQKKIVIYSKRDIMVGEVNYYYYDYC